MALLCVHGDPLLQATVARLAKSAGLEVDACDSAVAALHRLTSRDPVELMMVGSALVDGDGSQLIAACRLLSHRVALPIAFLLESRDLAASHGAFQAGATEVFQQDDAAGLQNFVREFSQAQQDRLFAGRVLLLEDSDSHAAYVGELCAALGLPADRAISVEQGLALFAANTYQLAVIDIVLEGMQSGLAMVRHIRQSPTHGRLPVLVISGFDDVARRIEALRAGASDFLNKPFAEEEFVWRVRRLLQDQALHEAPSAAEAPAARWRRFGLTAREAEICEALVLGKSDKAISGELGISFWTVRTHIQRVFSKLGVLNRRELMLRHLTQKEQ